MNRLPTTPANPNAVYTRPHTLITETFKYDEMKMRVLDRAETSNYALLRYYEIISKCNPTDYDVYKAWIKIWKQAYALVTQSLRRAKQLYKDAQRVSWTTHRIYLTDLDKLKDFANFLLRERQKMKLLNRYYMMARKERSNHV